MTPKITLLCLLLLLPSLSRAQAAKTQNDAKVEYLGGLTLCAEDPKALAAWYTQKLGVPVDHEYAGMYYGTLEFNGVKLNVGIHPVGVNCQKPPKGLSMTWHVSDYDGFLAKLAAKGLTSYKTDPPTGYGRFAYFHDPEGNDVAVWGD